ncbi:MAG: vWA domain-containing protein [Isosphaeraceae bacterium]
MLRDLIRRLEEVKPGLSQWFGDRLDLQLPAVGASVLTHLMMLAALGMAGYAAHTETHREFRTEVVNTSLEDFATLDQSALAELDNTVIAPIQGPSGPNLSALIVETPRVMDASSAPDLSKAQLTVAAGIVLPTVTSLDKTISVKGTGMEHVGGVEGAVDRVAVEVLRRMEKGRTLVVWAFDASGSLQSEREHLAKYIDGVYAHIADLDQNRLIRDGGLLTSVVSFGKNRKLLTPEPTTDRSTIRNAINDVELDSTGIESTFQTVSDIVRKWGRYKKDGQAYRTMIIVVTDEVGDDEQHLEEAIAQARAAKVPVYVLGSPALFGRVEGYVDYTDPKTKKTYRNLPVRQGPESVMLEGIRLPFWFAGPQYEFMDAGFGPYALSRLAGATGGIYFVTRMGATRITFDPAGMREYRPDWVSRTEYEKMIASKPLRRAVTQAAMVAQQNLPGQPSLEFPSADSPDFKEAMKRNQEKTARAEYTVRAALEPITTVAKMRDKETSRRWQAHYDLIRGRLLAMAIRCYEYNAACAQMMKDPRKFQDPASNAWRMVPTNTIDSEKRTAVAQEAKELLQRVVTSHPGTPWALMAQRELKDPFGFKWVEAKVPPPPKRNPAADAAKKKKKAEMPKPPELPKL